MENKGKKIPPVYWVIPSSYCLNVYNAGVSGELYKLIRRLRREYSVLNSFHHLFVGREEAGTISTARKRCVEVIIVL